MYYQPRVNHEDQRLMNCIDRIYTKFPFYGSRRIRWALTQEYGLPAGRGHVQKLMRLMGLVAIYPKTKPHTSLANAAHRKYPYLLKNLVITRPNHVWGTDITYVKLETGWAYLTVILDWFSRYVISWRLSDTLHTDFCAKALQAALRVATPSIHNSDQGCQYTSGDYTNILLAKNIQISMDGGGRCMDNIFTERLWRTVKYENIYLQSYHDRADATDGLTDYFLFYNTKRPHQSLDYRTPAQLYQ
jgi:putative transposase